MDDTLFNPRPYHRIPTFDQAIPPQQPLVVDDEDPLDPHVGGPHNPPAPTEKPV